MEWGGNIHRCMYTHPCASVPKSQSLKTPRMPQISKTKAPKQSNYNKRNSIIQRINNPTHRITFTPRTQTSSIAKKTYKLTNQKKQYNNTHQHTKTHAEENMNKTTNVQQLNIQYMQQTTNLKLKTSMLHACRK